MSEWKNVENMFQENKTPEQICKARTEYSIKWYIRKATWNKCIYYCLSFVGIMCPLLNAMFVVCWNCKLITVFFSSITSLSVSLLALTNAKSKWENYRSAAEFLKREYTLFQARASVYNKPDRTLIYLQTIEDFMQKVHINWQKIFRVDHSKDEK